MSVARAFVLISADSGAEAQIIQALKSIPYVTEVAVVYGVYDIVAKIEADTIDRVRDIITHKLSAIQNVRLAQIMLGSASS